MDCDHCHQPIEDGKDYQRSTLKVSATQKSIVYEEVKVGHYHYVCLKLINSGKAA